jgi:hypothetical protein
LRFSEVEELSNQPSRAILQYCELWYEDKVEMDLLEVAVKEGNETRVVELLSGNLRLVMRPLLFVSVGRLLR